MYDIKGFSYPELLNFRNYPLYLYLCGVATENMLEDIMPYASPEGSVRFYLDVFIGQLPDPYGELSDHFFQNVSQYCNISAVRKEVKDAAEQYLPETEKPVSEDTLIGIELICRQLLILKYKLSDGLADLNEFEHYLLCLLGNKLDPVDISFTQTDYYKQKKKYIDMVTDTLSKHFKLNQYDSEENYDIAQRVCLLYEMRDCDSWFDTWNSNGEIFFGLTFAEAVKKAPSDTEMLNAMRVIFKDLDLELPDTLAEVEK